MFAQVHKLCYFCPGTQDELDETVERDKHAERAVRAELDSGGGTHSGRVPDENVSCCQVGRMGRKGRSP